MRTLDAPCYRARRDIGLQPVAAVVQMQQVRPPPAEIPVGDLAGVDESSEACGLARRQLAEDMAAWSDDRARAVLARIGEIGGHQTASRDPLLRRSSAESD